MAGSGPGITKPPAAIPHQGLNSAKEKKQIAQSTPKKLSAKRGGRWSICSPLKKKQVIIRKRNFWGEKSVSLEGNKFLTDTSVN